MCLQNSFDKTHKESSWNNCTGRFTGCDHSVPTVLSCNGVCPIHHHRPPAICLGPMVCFFGQTPFTTTPQHPNIHKHKHHPPPSAIGYLSRTHGLLFWANTIHTIHHNTPHHPNHPQTQTPSTCIGHRLSVSGPWSAFLGFCVSVCVTTISLTQMHPDHCVQS